VVTLAAPGEPSQEALAFNDAKNAYLYGDYPRVVSTLTPLLEPDVLLADPDQVAKGYELLALAHAYQEHEPEARAYFEQLIRFRPDSKLNPALVPPQTIRLFETVRETLKEELAREREAILKLQREEEERRRLEGAQQIVVEKRRNSRLVAMVPFGVGQFQNDQPVAGALFLGSEVLAISLSIGFFAAVEDLRLDNGLFAREDLSRAESMQSAHLVSGGIALAVMAIGVVHALATFEEELDVKRTTVNPSGSVGLGPGGLVWEF